MYSDGFRWPEALRGIGIKKYFFNFTLFDEFVIHWNIRMLTCSHTIMLTKGEFFQYLCLRLAMACEPKREPSQCNGTKYYSLAQYIVVQALVRISGCLDIALRAFLGVFLLMIHNLVLALMK